MCIDLEKFVQRSSGIFGATGTGKSFLTRAVLAGLIRYNKASVLVFDMHNEYGFDDTASDTGLRVVGLKNEICGEGARGGTWRRGTFVIYCRFNLEISESDVATSDIELLGRELDLKETTATTLDALWNSFKRDWFSEFKAMTQEVITTEDGKKVPANGSVAAWANANGVNVMAAEALQNKLRRLFNKAYIVAKPAADSIHEIISALESGQHVVLSFGEHETDLDYLFVSNLLTRQIREAWKKKTNGFR